jgi:hypothetical protein
MKRKSQFFYAVFVPLLALLLIGCNKPVTFDSSARVTINVIANELPGDSEDVYRDLKSYTIEDLKAFDREHLWRYEEFVQTSDMSPERKQIRLKLISDFREMIYGS